MTPPGSDRADGPFPDGDDPREDFLRGWLPPEDRLWRHPSEIGTGRSRSVSTGPTEAPAFAHHARRGWAAALVGTGAAAAAITGAFLMDHTGTGEPASVAPVTTSSAPSGGDRPSPVIQAAARSAAHAVVSLQVVRSTGTTHSCGVVVQEGGLIAATADSVLGASSITAVSDGGRPESVSVIGIDHRSNVALLRLGSNLPVATFTDPSTVQAGRQVMVLSVGPVGQNIRYQWSWGTVDTAGATITDGSADGMAGIAANAPGAPTTAGSILLSTSGSVLGVYDYQSNGLQVFLPSDLLTGVSGDLAAHGRVVHGWLGVEGANASTPSGGALVTQVESGGPAAGRLQAGDVIDGLGNRPIGSMAQLLSDLYLLQPGAPVDLQVLRDGHSMTVEVDLAASP